MTKKKDRKKKTWSELKDVKCPNCKQLLTKDLFEGKLLGCACGFIITEKVKDLLVKRDHSDDK